MKNKKYRLNIKRFLFNIMLILFLFVLLFYSRIFIKEYTSKKNNEQFFIKNLKQSIKNAGTRETFEIAQKFLDKYPGSDYSGYAYFLTGKYYYENNEYNEAVADFQKAKDFYLEEDIRIILYLHLSYNYMCLNDISSSAEYANKVYSLLEKGKLKALASFQLALCYSAFKLYDKSIEHLEEVLKLTDDVQLKKQSDLEKLKILKKIDLQKAHKFEKIFNEKYKEEKDEEKITG